MTTISTQPTFTWNWNCCWLSLLFHYTGSVWSCFLSPSCLGRMDAEVSSGQGGCCGGRVEDARVQPVPESSDSSISYLALSTTVLFPAAPRTETEGSTATTQPWLGKWNVAALYSLSVFKVALCCPAIPRQQQFILQTDREDVWSRRSSFSSFVTYNQKYQWFRDYLRNFATNNVKATKSIKKWQNSCASLMIVSK